LEEKGGEIMGIVEWLKTPEGAFFVALPTGYFVGKWIEGKVREYTQKSRETMRETIREAISEGMRSTTNGGMRTATDGGFACSESVYITKILKELQEIKETVISNYKELSLRISNLESYRKKE
jgi:hypothetical protein